MADRKVLLVTGGSRGIGAAVCRMAASEGYDVAVNYVGNEAAARAVLADVEKAGRKGIVVQGDMAKDADIARVFDEVESRLGGLTHLVNNAGVIGHSGRLADADPAMIREVVDVNVTGALLVAREGARRMSTRYGGKGGAIVNLGSMASTLGAPGEYVWYAATKGAIDALTIGLSRELAAEGVRVNSVAPGLIDTDIHASGGQPDRIERLKSSVPIGRAGTAEEVAETILFLLSGRAGYVIGTNIKVSGGR